MTLVITKVPEDELVTRTGTMLMEVQRRTHLSARTV